MEIKVTATKDEKLNILYRALCNGMGYLGNFGLVHDFETHQYNVARDQLIAESKALPAFGTVFAEMICIEDVLIAMIREGGVIRLLDVESSDTPKEVGKLTLDLLNRNWDKVPASILIDYMNENDDLWSALNFMQYIAFGEQVYA